MKVATLLAMILAAVVIEGCCAKRSCAPVAPPCPPMMPAPRPTLEK